MSIISMLFLPDVALKFSSQWGHFALSNRLKGPIPSVSYITQNYRHYHKTYSALNYIYLLRI
jgi:hypothetical protein